MSAATGVGRVGRRAMKPQRSVFVTRAPLRIAVVVICLIWSLPTAGPARELAARRARTSRRPAGGRPCSHPLTTAQWTLQNYAGRARHREHGQRVHQQPHRDASLHGHPHHGRRVRGVRVRVDALPAPPHAVPRRRRRCSSCRSRWRSSRSSSSTGRSGINNTLPRCLAGAYRVRPAARDLPALQLHLRSCPGTSSRPRASTARRTSRCSRASSCRCRSRPSPRSRSSSSCGSGTTCSSRSCS